MKTLHNLEFESRPWHRDKEMVDFRVGTCYGLYFCTDKAYVIVAIKNQEPGNGHFTDVLQWFYESCKRDKKNLVFAEIMNKRFGAHMVLTHGFKCETQRDYISKLYTEMP